MDDGVRWAMRPTGMGRGAPSTSTGREQRMGWTNQWTEGWAGCRGGKATWALTGHRDQPPARGSF
ncbi:hypothetical protein BDQ94DRAFT_138289 [Aspergillus welwitschiae]|uniref:Uncharacterized protein n=1 Tax=Aspergillus welwitschiae TaxID=1341132 RepID=A0A3F3QCY5_9EURO|nr:hypothetical protein BDQ94DRAFT_138289 [Aspergillus welwitschiae]RDH36676.1 hypothetical protein BDQ94DRAFT_138289 [Aspergillus welwitschiae]